MIMDELNGWLCVAAVSFATSITLLYWSFSRKKVNGYKVMPIDEVNGKRFLGDIKKKW